VDTELRCELLRGIRGCNIVPKSHMSIAAQRCLNQALRTNTVLGLEARVHLELIDTWRNGQGGVGTQPHRRRCRPALGASGSRWYAIAWEVPWERRRYP
jgi:hypothetical protein